MTRALWVLIAGVALLTAVLAMLWREDNPAWKNWQARYDAEPNVTPVPFEVRALTPTSTGRPELCVTCHLGIEDISASHPAEAFGCVVCHGGNRLALDADRAHAGMRGGRNPSDLSVAAQSCGQPNCHGGYADVDAEQNHVDRVLRSVQATYAGGIAAVRYTFGIQKDPAAQMAIHAIADSSRTLPPRAIMSLGDFLAATNGTSVETRFTQSCLNSGCHLWSAPKPATYYYRSTGCAACHYLYSDEGLYRGKDPTIPRDEPGHGTVHRLTTAIPYTQCDHCHNRGNYSLKQMTFLPREDLPPVANPLSALMPPEGRRRIEYYQPLGEYTRCEIDLDCVDCHTAQEAMGDGHISESKKDSQYIQCQTCHGTPTAAPHTSAIADPNELAMRQARINGHADFFAVGDQVIETERGERLWSIKQTANGFVQMSKVTGQIYTIPLVMGSGCKQDGKTQTSDYCHTCHVVER